MHGWQANLKRTCASPVIFRVLPENEIPPCLTEGYSPDSTSASRYENDIVEKASWLWYDIIIIK